MGDGVVVWVEGYGDGGSGVREFFLWGGCRWWDFSAEGKQINVLICFFYKYGLIFFEAYL